MCGRIRQARNLWDYLEALRWSGGIDLGEDTWPSVNVPPGTRPLTLHRLGDGSEQIDLVYWGYQPPKAPRLYLNARLDKIIANSGFWKRQFEHGRVIIPADGWYEWTGEKPNKQPWFISPKDGAPILMATISAWRPGDEHNKEHGMAIVTDDSAGGMVDIHDRRPITLAPNDALEWIDPATTNDQAKEILATARSESAFQWWQVTKAMGNSKYQLADASDPLG